MHFFIQGGGATHEHGSFSTYEEKEDYEATLEHKIQSGRINDRDIEYILNNGDSRLRMLLDRRHNELYNEKKHIDRIYGEGIFDGRDTEGNLYKDLTPDTDDFI